MATGRNNFLWLLVVHLGGIILVLNVLLWLTTISWSGWEPLSKMTCKLDSILLSGCHCQRVQLHSHSITGFADQSVQAFGVRYTQPAVSSHNSIEDSTGHHRLIKQPEHSPVDVELPQPSH